MRCNLLGGALVAATLTGSAFAAPVPWTMPSGTAGSISYTNGGSDNGLYGDPTIIVTPGYVDFVFRPANFRAESENLDAETVSDRLFVTLEVTDPALSIQSIQVNEAGDYSITGPGQVRASGGLFVTNLTTAVVAADLLDTNPTFPVTSGTGLWTGQAEVTSNLNGTRFDLAIDNILQAASQAGGTAFIEKKFEGVKIRIDIPEPTSGLAMLGTGLIALRRRRA